jgi:iron(III) transport system substrate-binding protein
VFYNNTGIQLAEALAAGFNKKYPNIRVEAINAGTGELLTRIRAEKNAPRGDVTQLTMEAFDSSPELFMSYKSKEHDRFPPEAIGPNNLYYGFQVAFQILMVNTDLMKPSDAPRSWKDLADPKYKGKILMAHPANSGSAYSQLAQIVQLHGWDVMEKVVANVTVVPRSGLTYAQVARGETPLGIVEETKVFNEAAKGFPVKPIYPTEGTGMRIEGVAIIKGAPNLDNAKLFADFMNSKEGHEINVKVRQRRVPRDDVTQPPGLPPLSQVKTFPYDAVLAAKNQDANLRRFTEIFGKKKN